MAQLARQMKLPAGGTIEAYNKGGEFHTFTEVANYGGGCVDELNALLGLTPVPECANAGVLFGDDRRGAGRRSRDPCPPGRCPSVRVPHPPWMRTTVTVRG